MNVVFGQVCATHIVLGKELLVELYFDKFTTLRVSSRVAVEQRPTGRVRSKVWDSY